MMPSVPGHSRFPTYSLYTAAGIATARDSPEGGGVPRTVGLFTSTSPYWAALIHRRSMSDKSSKQEDRIPEGGIDHGPRASCYSPLTVGLVISASLRTFAIGTDRTVSRSAAGPPVMPRVLVHCRTGTYSLCTPAGKPTLRIPQRIWRGSLISAVIRCGSPRKAA